MVGEMRDSETIEWAVTAAETGHLVLSSLHTNTAASTVDRIVDVFPPNQQAQIRVQLANNLVAVLSQQLLPRARTPGRIAAMEVMIATPAIRNLIRESKAHQIPSVLQTGTEEGMTSMDQALVALCKKGVIAPELAFERAVDVDEFKRMLYGR
jgi:twitching motility protein PilT